jgi:hypothetical protein
MRNACVQLVLYKEGHRVFLQEKRIALGLGVQVVSFLALLNLVYVIYMVDGVTCPVDTRPLGKSCIWVAEYSPLQ